jgi:hypothetical protein
MTLPFGLTNESASFSKIPCDSKTLFEAGQPGDAGLCFLYST